MRLHERLVLAVVTILAGAGVAGATPIQFGTSGMFFEQVVKTQGCGECPIGSGITWAEANAAANAMTYGGAQGHLADPKTAALDAFLIETFDVFNHFNPNNSNKYGDQSFGPWIGLHYSGSGSPANMLSYVWSDGSAFDPYVYNGWHRDQGDNSQDQPSGDASPGVDYFDKSGHGWNDEGCQGECNAIGPVSFLVQYDTLQGGPSSEVPEPASLTLLGLGLASLGLRLRRKTR